MHLLYTNPKICVSHSAIQKHTQNAHSVCFLKNQNQTIGFLTKNQNKTKTSNWLLGNCCHVGPTLNAQLKTGRGQNVQRLNFILGKQRGQICGVQYISYIILLNDKISLSISKINFIKLFDLHILKHHQK